MADSRNLIYNADFSQGLDHWLSTCGISALSASNGILTVNKGDQLLNNVLVPMVDGDTYRLSFDIKFNTVDSNEFYISIRPFDSDKKLIPISETLKQNGNTDTDTILTKAVANGDTTITVEDASKWYNTDPDYFRKIGICTNIAWRTYRAVKLVPYASVSGNVITLTSPWTAGAYPVGTKIANFRAGNVYYYPWHRPPSTLPTQWTHVSVTFTSDRVRKFTQYIQFSTYGYNHVYQLKNLRFENISSHQVNPLNGDHSSGTSEFDLQATASTPVVEEVGIPIRYVKDTINGNTSNTSNHWMEIRALDPQGVNVAFNKNSSIDGGGYAKRYCTSGRLDLGQYDYASPGVKSIVVDLGFVTRISKVQVWHWFGDTRTYHDNVIEVSEDGTHWITVYMGEQQETSEGLSVLLSPSINRIYDTGTLETNKIVEY